MNQYLIYVIPLFLIFVILEMVADIITQKKAYRFEDTITNISLGIGQQIIEALIKTIFSFLFLWAYKFSLFKIPDTIWTFLAVVLICDFIFYWFHRFSHKVNFLWAVHIVHHQSSEFNLSVSLRQPWLHKFAMFAFFLVIPFLGVSPTIMVLAFAVQTFYQFWLHTRFIGKLGILENILVTPSHHRVHHGVNAIYINKNFGNTLIIWDKIFGTFQPENEPVVFGVTQPFTSTNPIWANIYYWKEIIAKVRSKKDLLNKLKIFLQKPVGSPPEKIVTAKGEHINSFISGWVKSYIIVQYILTFSTGSLFLFRQDSFSFLWKIISVLFIIWSIYSYSALMQKKKNSIFWELARLFIFILLIYIFLMFDIYKP
ncbi:MAG TPA: sterol desaturase family protein [Chitinophagaceae bacterium]|nr:sterol desaturase family protein [Chitinophagaceae bacterium]